MNRFQRDSYNYPGDKITFSEDQTEAINFALERLPKPVILGLQAGYGKTLTSLAIARQLMLGIPNLVTFIVCPKSATLAFKKECPNLNLRYSIFVTDEQHLDRKARVMIFNYNTANKYMPQMIEKLKEHGFKIMLIADEAHSLKSPSTGITKFFNSIRKDFCYVLGLTATVLLNHLEDCFNIINFVRPGFFESYSWFTSNFIVTKKKTRSVKGRRYQYNAIIGYRNLDILKDILKNIVLVKRKHYNINFYQRKCKLTEAEWDIYQRAANGEFQDPNVDADLTFGSRIHDIQRAADGTLPGYESKDMSKIKLLLETLREIVEFRQEGSLVYMEYESSYQIIYNAIKASKKFIPYHNLYLLTGQSSSEERQHIVRNLKARDIVVMTKAGCASLNLQAVNNIVYFNTPFAVGQILQSSGRICRTDSTYSEQNIYYLTVEDSIDIYRGLLISGHRDLINALFDGEEEVLPQLEKASAEIIRKYKNYFKQKFLWKAGKK